MKRVACAVLLASLSICLPAHADGLPVSPFLVRPSLEVQRRQIEFNNRSAATDDYLIALARAGDVNILADVTDVPDAAPDVTPAALPTPSRKPMLGILVFDDLVKQRGLTVVDLDDHTMLFWPSPDESRMAQAIAERRAAAPRHDPPPLSAEKANAMLREYFQNTHQWDGKWDKVDISVPVEQLPPDLRAQVEAEVYWKSMRPHSDDRSPFAPGLQFWKETRLVVSPRSRVPRGAPTPFLTTPNSNSERGYSPGTIIGSLGFLVRR